VELSLCLHLVICIKNPVDTKVSGCRCAKLTSMNSNIILVDNCYIMFINNLGQKLRVDIVILKALTLLSFIEDVTHFIKESIIELETWCVFIASHGEGNIHIM